MRRRKKDAIKRSLFRDLQAGVEAMWEHREGRLTLRSHHSSCMARLHPATGSASRM
jgi:hypothetical protein